jgi:hypothetical protein
MAVWGGCLGLASFWQIVERRSRQDSFDPTAAAHLSPRPPLTLSSKAQSTADQETKHGYTGRPVSLASLLR